MRQIILLKNGNKDEFSVYGIRTIGSNWLQPPHRFTDGPKQGDLLGEGVDERNDATYEEENRYVKSFLQRLGECFILLEKSEFSAQSEPSGLFSFAKTPPLTTTGSPARKKFSASNHCRASAFSPCQMRRAIT